MSLNMTRTALAAAVALGAVMATTGALAHGHGGGGGGSGGGGHGHAGGGHAFAGHAFAARAGGVPMMATHVSVQPSVGQVFAPRAPRYQSFAHPAGFHLDNIHRRHVHRRVFFAGAGPVFYDWPYDGGSCRVLTARGWVWVC
jgi:hypothetical protein